jgi:hypothetical protein
VAAALEEGHRELAHLLFADLPPDLFDCFATGLGQVLTRLRERLLAEETEEGTDV